MDNGMAVKKVTPEYILEIRDNKYSVENAVSRILEECGIDKYPVDVWKIAKTLGFTVFEANFKDDCNSGMMFDKKEVPEAFKKYDAKRAIVLNRKESAIGQAFTVAHEIAHFSLHVNDKDDFFEAFHISKVKKIEDFNENDKQLKKREDEADNFAANLLMPTNMFLKFIINSPNKNSKEKLKSELTSAFLVEEEAVERRFKELSINF